MREQGIPTERAVWHLADAELAAFVRAVFKAVGADDPTADAATAVMMHASRLGIDSHGVRLTPHYARGIAIGEVNGRPTISFTPTRSGAGILDAHNGHGALAGYHAMRHAIALAKDSGVGAVTVCRSSHFGAAGAYAMEAAAAGMIGFVTCNSDPLVSLHGGRDRFHGTNPLAIAAPVGNGERPWLLDLATSSIPFNRMKLYGSLGLPLPEGTAADGAGRPTRDPAEAVGLLPLGGVAFGYKGAGLAGLAEVLSAALTGMRAGHALPPWADSDGTPRELGQFMLAIDPEAFLPRSMFEAGMRTYLAALRSAVPVDPAAPPLAPGDREWRVEAARRKSGIPIDPETAAAFTELAATHGLTLPAPL